MTLFALGELLITDELLWEAIPSTPFRSVLVTERAIMPKSLVPAGVMNLEK